MSCRECSGHKNEDHNPNTETSKRTRRVAIATFNVHNVAVCWLHVSFNAGTFHFIFPESLAF